MKKVVFLGDTLAGENAVGIQRFAREILHQMDNMELPFNVEVLVPEYADVHLDFNKIKIVRYGRIHNAFLWRQLCYTEYAKKQHALAVDLTLGLPLLKCDVVCLYDCIYEDFPKDFVTAKEQLKRLSYLLRVKMIIRNAKQIITVSQASRRELANYYHIPEEKISIINCSWQHFASVHPDDKILNKFHLSNKEYFFSLGSRLKHKNFEWIISAAQQNPKYIFVVTGRSDLSHYQVKNRFLKNLVFTGYLSDSEIKSLMQHCKTFVHPSLYEGFGIPPLEALSCGTPILISYASCLPEIYGNAARYFDPQKYEKIDVDELLQRPVGPAEPILNRYSWTDSAKKTKKVIMALL